MEYNIYESLNEAYGKSTLNNNLFKKAVESVKWESVFKADGEIYFQFGKLTLTVESLNPFKEAWKPSVIIGTFFRELGTI